MLMTGSDERTVAAIERLTKQKFEVRPASAPRSGRREPERDRERGARPERRERDERPRRSHAPPPSKPVDEFFSKPYEPSAAPALAPPADAETPTTTRRPPGRVSALLGGGKK
jgi:hypothetical protein